MPMESGAVVLCLGSVAVMLRRRITSPLMMFFAAALLLFAQAALAFMLAKPWDHMWWLAHVVFAAGFSVIGWGVIRALLTTKSFALAFSQEQLMRALEKEREMLDAANLQLLAERQLARTTLDALPEHVCVLDENGYILAVNARWQEFVKSNSGDAVRCGIGTNYLTICDQAAGKGSEGAETAAAGIRSVLQGTEQNFIMEYTCDSPSQQRWFLLSALRAEAADGVRVVIAHQNISERKWAEFHLRHLAMIDGLTGIANRRAFDETLEQERRRAGRAGTPLSLLLIDVDHFKAYNDHYGHQAGDECLRAVAAALDAAVQRPADLAARYGGEEFAIILPSTPLADAQSVAEKMRLAIAALGMPHQASQTAPHVTISIGLSCLTAPTTSVGRESLDAAALIADADAALYAAKSAGRNGAFARAG